MLIEPLPLEFCLIVTSLLNLLDNVSSKVLNSHISWDIGAKDLCEKVSKALGQSYFYANFSRLLIDPNRHLFSSDLIVTNSWGQTIPGNIDISFEKKKKKIEN